LGVKKIFFACIFIFAVYSSFASDWKLVWSDEFDKPGLPDPAKWNYETGFVRNREAQYYTASRLENARVENGCLVIEARKESFNNPAFDATANTNDWIRSREFASYTSASLTTRERFSWKYGRIEVRAKLPSGRGVWPAIWTLGTNEATVGWPACGEIDIMEMVGFRPDMIYGHIHTLESVKTKKVKDGTGLKIPGASDDFHIYAIEWNPDRMDFLVDGKKYYTYHNPHTGEAAWPFDKDQYLILNLAIGGAWGGAKGIDDTIFPQRFYIDYVHVYQKQ
jgi:beta-glucanase (GH16 family)